MCHAVSCVVFAVFPCLLVFMALCVCGSGSVAGQKPTAHPKQALSHIPIVQTHDHHYRHSGVHIQLYRAVCTELVVCLLHTGPLASFMVAVGSLGQWQADIVAAPACGCVCLPQTQWLAQQHLQGTSFAACRGIMSDVCGGSMGGSGGLYSCRLCALGAPLCESSWQPCWVLGGVLG